MITSGRSGISPLCTHARWNCLNGRNRCRRRAGTFSCGRIRPRKCSGCCCHLIKRRNVPLPVRLGNRFWHDVCQQLPHGWQGGLGFRYHLGPAGVRVHLVSEQEYQRRIIWDVIGRIKGAELPDEWVIEGNHRDAWVYGAVDPSSGTAALLEAVHGVGVLLHQCWRPRRTMVFASWDAEEEGLIGSTEWAEQNAAPLEHAVAYFNVDSAVSGPDFSASAVPSLKQFVRDLTHAVAQFLVLRGEPRHLRLERVHAGEHIGHRRCRDRCAASSRTHAAGAVTAGEYLPLEGAHFRFERLGSQTGL